MHDTDVRDLFTRAVEDEPPLGVDVRRAAHDGRTHQRRRALFAGGVTVLAAAVAVTGVIVAPSFNSSARVHVPLSTPTPTAPTPEPSITASVNNPFDYSNSPDELAAKQGPEAEMTLAMSRAAKAVDDPEAQKQLAERMIKVAHALGHPYMGFSGPDEDDEPYKWMYTWMFPQTTSNKKPYMVAVAPPGQPATAENVCERPVWAEGQCERAVWDGGVVVWTLINQKEIGGITAMVFRNGSPDLFVLGPDGLTKDDLLNLVAKILAA